MRYGRRLGSRSSAAHILLPFMNSMTLLSFTICWIRVCALPPTLSKLAMASSSEAMHGVAARRDDIGAFDGTRSAAAAESVVRSRVVRKWKTRAITDREAGGGFRVADRCSLQGCIFY